jgi:iron complex outermembrane receptor protein
VDGNTTETQPCAVPGLLCFGDDATPANGLNGAQLSDTFNGAQLGQIDRTRTTSRTLGAQAQATHAGTLLDRANRFQMGASVDHAATRFDALSELGVIGRDFRVTGSGVFLGPSGSPTAIGPVSLDAASTYLGAWASDTLDVTKDLSATVGGRFNAARIVLEDQLGTALNGVTRVQRFNPLAGLTYKLAPDLTAYAGVSQANRAPTPLELGCSDPLRPCLIDSFLVSDPPLKQVVSTTAEAGLRGALDLPDAYGRISWKAGVFSTRTRNEILNVPSAIQGFGYFANMGATRRQGLELDATWRGERLSVFASYTLLDATFRNGLTLSSPNNPSADANGEIHVTRGDRLPMIPRHRFKAGLDFALTPSIKVHADTILVSGQYLEGDAANQNPKLPGYALVNAGAAYRVDKTFEVFARVDNLFDRRVYAFGTYFEMDQIAFANFTDPRTFSPARPRTVYVGARATF